MQNTKQSHPFLSFFPLLRIVFLFAFVGFLTQCTGTRPETLGVRQGKLMPCPSSPNCVSSFESEKDETHFFPPYTYKKSLKDLYADLKTIIAERPRTEIIKEEPNYLYIENTSFLMRYVDDLEFVADDSKKLLHFRSASRLGKSDLGVNRKRVTQILEKLKEKE